MCVQIDRYVKNPTNKIRWAWKAISTYSTPTVWKPICQPGNFKRGQWVKARNSQYGFNCYTTREGALAWASSSDVVVKVRVRKVHGFGEDNGRVIFAREIFVPKGRS
jgi:hypothetical protein